MTRCSHNQKLLVSEEMVTSNIFIVKPLMEGLEGGQLYATNPVLADVLPSGWWLISCEVCEKTWKGNHLLKAPLWVRRAIEACEAS
jgi:hypothetical protein